MNYPYTPNKFNATRSNYKGRSYHSKLETEYAMWLDSLMEEGKIVTIVPQHRIDLYIEGKKITSHYVDFAVKLADGREKWVEAKGMPTEVWRIKQRLCEALYPDIPYLVNPNEKQLFA